MDASAVGSGAGVQDCDDGDDAIDHWRSVGVYQADVDVLGRGPQVLLRPARPALTPADLGIDMAGGMAGVDHAGYDDQWGEAPPDWEADEADARSAEAELRQELAEARVGRTPAERAAYLVEALGHVPSELGPTGLERRQLAARSASLAAALGAAAADAEVQRVQARWLQRAVERAAWAARATRQPVAWVACRYGQECRRRGCWWQHPHGRRMDWEADERRLEAELAAPSAPQRAAPAASTADALAAHHALAVPAGVVAAPPGAVPAPAPAAGDAANVAALEALAVPAGVVSVGRAEPTAAAVEQRLAALRAGGTTRGAKRAAPATSTPAGSAKTQQRRRSRRVAAAARGGGRSSGGAVLRGAGAA